MSNQWIENNIDKMMAQITTDARYQRPLPLSITLHGIAFRKFIDILKSKNAFFPDALGNLSFLGISVHVNNKLPMGTFLVERFSEKAGLLR